MIGIITFVGKIRHGLETVDEVMRKRDVVALSGRADQSDWKAECFCGSMDFGAQSTARPTQAWASPFERRARLVCPLKNDPF
jgi:hypothetical protein